MKVILDTNFFILPGKLKIDIFSEIDRIIDEKYEIVTIKPVINELRGLAREKGKKGMHAKLGLQLIEKKKVKILKTRERDADKAILKASEKEDDVIVGTLDKELRKKLEKSNKKTIYLRAKKYLVLG